jgi:hypothetical protein
MGFEGDFVERRSCVPVVLSRCETDDYEIVRNTNADYRRGHNHNINHPFISAHFTTPNPFHLFTPVSHQYLDTNKEALLTFLRLDVHSL